nr:lariat debranching enzyme isoform X1 [Tanacetum cinerariifolium]
MKIAIEGCMHGDLDNVYATLLHLQQVENTKIDLLICCGDFQAVRNRNDLDSLSFGNIRIAGLSGIYKRHDYHLGHFERPPYNTSDIKSVYHVREYDVHKLMQIEEPVDIFVSHDWPLGVTDHGDWEDLIRNKPFFEAEIMERKLGSKPAAELLEKL